MNNVQLSGNMVRYSKTVLARNGNAFAFLTDRDKWTRTGWIW